MFRYFLIYTFNRKKKINNLKFNNLINNNIIHNKSINISELNINLSNNYKTIYIDIDNKFILYENNIDFSNYSSDIKPIAVYSPKCYQINDNYGKIEQIFNEWDLIRNAKSLFKGHHQPRKPGDEIEYLGYYNLIDSEIIKRQVKLAKIHGIFGFAIYYYWLSKKTLFEKPLKIYLENKDINFPFLLVWKNVNCSELLNSINIFNNLQFNDKDSEQFIKDIKKYITDERYIKINQKPVIGIYDYYNINYLNKTINIWRNKSREYGIGEIYIFINLINYNNEALKNSKLFDAAYEFFPNDELVNFTLIYTLIRIYSSSIYFNNNINNINNDFPIFKCCMVEWDSSIKKGKKGIVFDSYSPEQFYYLNRIMINWTNNFYNNSNKYFFINSWNDWDKGSYLEPDEKYGYSSINAFSKALFNINYRNQNYNILKLVNSSKIAIQAHIFYEDLVNEIIANSNNIPVKYDLFITTTSLNKSIIIENYIKTNSNANKYEIKIVDNKGRDIIPFLTQIKTVYKNYKYICHIHTKKSKHNIQISKQWRNYLFGNLLGGKEVISEILTDFENFDQLGFIFPENYFFILSEESKKREPFNKIHINYLLKKMFPENKYEAGELLDFPSGDMFWAKIKAIYQIFEITIDDKIPNEEGQLDCTIMHGIERVWLYIVKLNGYYYKKIFIRP